MKSTPDVTVSYDNLTLPVPPQTSHPVSTERGGTSALPIAVGETTRCDRTDWFNALLLGREMSQKRSPRGAGAGP